MLPLVAIVLLLFVLVALRRMPSGVGEPTNDNLGDTLCVKSGVEPFSFDPNSATFEELLALGLPKRAAVSVLKYRAAGGTFSIPEEFSLCYGVSDSLYQALKPYIAIAPQFELKPFEPKPRQPLRDTVIRYEPFRIDTVGVAYLRTIGFSHRRATALLNYRDARGGLRNMEEVRECYVISSEECDSLERYIIFPASDGRKEALKQPIDINRCSAEELARVKGISSEMASRIVDYRRKLGGFLCKEQLMELKWDKERDFLQIFEQIYCDSCNISKIDVNFARSQRIGVHPYISDLALRKLIKTRELKGGWSTIEEMIDDDIFTRDEAERLRPYLRFAYTE